MALTQVEAPPIVLCLAGNQMWWVYSTNQTAQAFIGIYYRVQLDISGSWVDQGVIMRFEPDDNGQAAIDVHAMLEWDPEKEFTWPEFSPAFLASRPNLVKSYRLQIYEKFGNPLTQTDYETSGSGTILPGKIPELRFGRLNDQSKTFLDEIFANKTFLTNSPRVKRTDYSAIERLSHYVFSTLTTSLKLMVKCYYSDGTDVTITKQTLTSVTAHIVYEIITSLSTLDLPLGGDGVDIILPVEKYDVWLTDQSDTTISEVFTYQVDQTPHDDAKYFLFANAFKMIEGARFVNHLKTHTQPSQTEITRKLSKGFGLKDASLVKDNITEVVYQDVSSEWLSVSEIKWLRELTLSKEVYEIVDGQPVPIRVKAASVISHQINKNLRQLNMTYSYGHADSVPADYSDFS